MIATMNNHTVTGGMNITLAYSVAGTSADMNDATEITNKLSVTGNVTGVPNGVAEKVAADVVNPVNPGTNSVRIVIRTGANTADVTAENLIIAIADTAAAIRTARANSQSVPLAGAGGHDAGRFIRCGPRPRLFHLWHQSAPCRRASRTAHPSTSGSCPDSDREEGSIVELGDFPASQRRRR